MRLRIDATRCEAYGACVEHAPQAIQLDEWGYAHTVGDGVVDDAAGQRAIDDCPARAVLRDG